MAKIINKGKTNHLVGIVTYINDTNSQVTNLSTTLNEWDPETKTASNVYFNAAGWDNSAENGDSANLPARIKKAKVSVGSLLLMRCGAVKDNGEAKDGTPRKTAPCYDFQYSGIVENEKESIVLGNIGNTEKYSDGFGVSLAVNIRKDETRWVNVIFKGKTAEAVEKIAVKGKPFAAIGELKDDKMNAVTFVASNK